MYELESDIEEHDESEEDDEKDWQDIFFRLRKTQEQLENYAVEIEVKMRKKEEKNERKRGRRKILHRRKHLF